jgi:hypothetical protein
MFEICFKIIQDGEIMGKNNDHGFNILVGWNVHGGFYILSIFYVFEKVRVQGESSQIIYSLIWKLKYQLKCPWSLGSKCQGLHMAKECYYLFIPVKIPSYPNSFSYRMGSVQLGEA